MSRQAPTPSVKFILNSQTPEDGKMLGNNLLKAHLLAVRSVISSLNLSNTDMEAMKKLLGKRRTILSKAGGTDESK